MDNGRKVSGLQHRRQLGEQPAHLLDGNIPITLNVHGARTIVVVKATGADALGQRLVVIDAVAHVLADRRPQKFDSGLAIVLCPEKTNVVREVRKGSAHRAD